MAAKNPVSAKTKAAKAQAKKTAQKAAPVGLHSTAAQWKTYQKAYTAAYQNIRINQASRALRGRRQQAATKAIQASNSARHQAQAAAVAAFAAQQSARGAQGTALSARVNENLRVHLAVLSRAQYAEASSRTYMQKAVQQTMTAGAAHTYEEKAFKAATKIARSSYKTTKFPKKRGRPVKLLGGSANARNNQTQNVDTPLKQSTTLSRGFSSAHQGSAKQNAKSNRATAKGNRTQAAQAKSKKASHATSAKSKKAPVKVAKSRTAPRKATDKEVKDLLGIDPWESAILKTPVPQIQFGKVPSRPASFTMYGIPLLNESTGWYSNEDEPVCVVTALANHLLATTGLYLYQHEMQVLNSAIRFERQARILPSGYDILTVLLAAKAWPFSDRVKLKNFWRCGMNDPITEGLVIGYEAEQGPHAALLLPGWKVVSWGEELPLRASIEEAWVLEWEVNVHG